MTRPGLLLTMLIGLSIMGCKSTLMLREHHRELIRLSSGDLSPEETFEGLSQVFVDVFEDAKSLPNPDQRVNFIRKFAKQNDEEIRLILRNMQEWQQSLRPLEKGRMAIQLVRQPSTQALIRILPEFLQLLNENDQELSRMRKLLLMYRVRQWLMNGEGNE